MLTNLAYLLVLLSGSVFCAAYLNKRFEQTIALTQMSMIAILFLSGLMGLLGFGSVLVAVLAAVLYALALVKAVKGSWKQLLANLATPGFLVFCIAFFGLSFVNNGRVAHAWDEFSHWMDVVKAMTMYNDFGTHPLADCSFASYPPGISLLEYFFQRVNFWVTGDAALSEWRVYLGFQMFFISLLYPFMKDVSFRRPVRLVLMLCIAYVAPLTFFNEIYDSVYVDPLLGILSGSGLAMILLWKERDWLYHTHIALSCVMLVLMKDAGMLFAVILALAYGGDLLLRQDRNSLTKKDWLRPASLAIMPLALTLLVSFLWKMEVSLSGVERAFAGKYDLMGFGEPYRGEVLINFLNTISDVLVPMGYFEQSIWGAKVSCVQLLLIYAAVCYILWKLCCQGRPNSAARGYVLILLMIQCLGYTGGLCATYMFKYEVHEALGLYSLARYMNIMFLAGWLVFLLAGADAIDVQSPKAGAWEAALALVLVLLVPRIGIYDFLAAQRDDSTFQRAGYMELADRVTDAAGSDSRIWIISQGDSGGAYHIYHFLLRPNFVQGGPSIYAELKEDDIRGRQLSAEGWKAELKEGTDYVVLYWFDDRFLEDYSQVFENAEEITRFGIYRVNRENGTLALWG